MEVVTIKVPLYPTKEQVKEFNTLSYCYHKLGNMAVELLKKFGYDMKESGLRKSLNNLKSDIPGNNLGFIITVTAREKSLAFRKHGKVNYHKWQPNYKRFPVRCDTNDNRISRIYSDDLETIKIPSVKGKVKISYNWCQNIIKRKGRDYLDLILNYKKQTARVTYDGKYWYLVYTICYIPEEIELTGDAIGIDVGIEKLVTTYQGKYYKGVNNSKRVIALEKREKKLQRILSRKYRKYNKPNKYEKSNNIRKLERRIALVKRRLKNIRETELHRISKHLVDLKPKVIALEDLNIKGMLKNKYLAPKITKQGWYKLTEFIAYKARSSGITVIKVNRWFSSSKNCSRCNHHKSSLKLSDRLYKCNNCGLTIDRDLNAAINIRNEGLRLAAI